MPIEYLEQVQRKATKLAKISKKAYESKRGRPRMTWKDNIKKWTGLDNDDLLQSVEDRRNWRMIVHKAANPRTEDG